MGQISSLAAEAFRPFVTDGVPASGVNEPSKSDIVALFASVDGALSSAINGLILGGAVVWGTLAQLNADLAHGANALGVVYNDSTTANIGVYVKAGAAGSGSWALTALALPSSFAPSLAAAQSAITAETARATAAETANSTAVVNETVRASGAEAGVGTVSAVNLRFNFFYSGSDILQPIALDAANNVALGINTVNGALAGGSVDVYTFLRQHALALQSVGLSTYAGTEDAQPVWTDIAGGVILSFSKTTGLPGGWLTVGISALAQQAAALANAISGVGFQLYSGADPLQPIYLDKNGGKALGIRSDTGALGGSAVDALVTSLFGGQTLPPGLRPIQTNWIAATGYGESTSIGLAATGAPVSVISATQPYSNLTFDVGPKATKTGNTFGGSNNGMASLKALIEDLHNPEGDANVTGETFCSGMANDAVTRAAMLYGASTASPQIFSSTAGHGGYTISQLVKGAGWYQDLLDHTQVPKGFATTAGKTYSVAAIALVLGHNDAGAGTTRAAYAAAVLGLIGTANADILAFTGQSSPVHFLINQTSSLALTTNGAICLAQTDIVASDVRAHFVAPWYFLPYQGDGVHPTSPGQRWYGAYLGRALAQLIWGGKVPDSIVPISATAKGTTLTIRFNVPMAPLVLDTTLLGAATNNGFKVSDASGTLTLSGMTVVGGNTVQMTLSRALAGSPVVRYALDYLGAGLNISGGASGNLRDSTPDTVNISGTPFSCYHWAPHFQLTPQILDPNS